MMAIIANWAMVPPKLMPVVLRKLGVNNGSSASKPKPTTPTSHLAARGNVDHAPRRASPGASNVLVTDPADSEP